MSTPASGILVVDKPAGMSSHGVVAAVRRALGMRKVGHAGTLDPMATGVLVLGVGAATRLLGHLALKDKEYDATIRLGADSSSDDAEGEIRWTDSFVSPHRDQIEEAMSGYRGFIEQCPSAVSAIKVEGKRAYARVRAGEAVELKARPVRVSRFDVLAVNDGITPAGHDYRDVDVRVECSTGTYVRALARDVGKDLGVGGHLVALRRTRVGPFTLAEAVALDEVDADHVQPLYSVIPRIMPTVKVDESLERSVRYGQKLTTLQPLASPDVVALCAESGEPLALATCVDSEWKYVMVFPQDAP